MSINISLRQMRAFQAVAESGSFTRAAQHLHLTQSALSVLVRELERELRVSLFDRHTRRVDLSEAGLEFLPKVRRLLNDLDGAVHEVEALRDQKKGVLRIAATQLMACTLIAQGLALYSQRFPGVTIQFQDALPEHLLSLVRAGDVEMAVGPESEVDPQQLVRSTVLRDKHWLVCLPDHPLALHKSLCWPDLAGQSFVAPTRDFVERMRRNLGAASEPLLREPVREVSYFTTAFGLVAAGMGVTVSPTYATRLVHSYGLIMLPVGCPDLYREVCTYTQADRALSPAAAGFVQCLSECVGRGQGG